MKDAEKDKKQRKLWNVPNVLTMLRLLSIPVYLWANSHWDKKWTLVIFLLASFTDLLDGQIARHFNIVTTFGKIMDPVADKLMIITVMLSQTLNGVLPALPVMLVIVKEGLLLLGGAILLKKKLVIPSEMIGKVAQVMFVAALFLSFFHDFFLQKAIPLDVIFLWISVGLSYLALLYYAKHSYQLMRKSIEKADKKRI